MNRPRARRIGRMLSGLIVLGACLGACAGQRPALWNAESADWHRRLAAADAEGVSPAAGRAVQQLSPYPSVIDGELFLVACRWPSMKASGASSSEVKGWPIPVYSELDGETAVWAESVVSSLDRSLPEVAFRWVGKVPEEADLMRGIRLLDASKLEETALRGLGDTLATCEHSPDTGRASARLVAAEIRIRRTRTNQFDVPVTAAPHEWAGALGHELGHALGFQGHVRGVPSLMGLSEDVLRRKGRRMLAGKRVEAPALIGLSLLESGEILGRRALSAMTKSWLARIEISCEGLCGLHYSRVGDEAAEIEWRFKDGTKYSLRFPFWRQQLSGEGAIVGVPTRETREFLTREELERKTAEPRGGMTGVP